METRYTRQVYAMKPKITNFSEECDPVKEKVRVNLQTPAEVRPFEFV